MKPKQPFSWFASIAKEGTKQIVVVALVEEAGTGAQIAAPIVRKVLEQYFGITTSGGLHVGVKAD
jgi:penicillin-binding protein 2